MNVEDRQALRRIAEKADQGEWLAFICDDGKKWTGWPLSISTSTCDDKTIVRTGGMWPYEWDASVSQSEAVANAQHIAAACPRAILALLDALDAAELRLQSVS